MNELQLVWYWKSLCKFLQIFKNSMQIQFPTSCIWDPVILIFTSVHLTHLDIKPSPLKSIFGGKTHPWPSSFSYSEAQTFTDWWGRAAGDWVIPRVDHQSRKTQFIVVKAQLATGLGNFQKSLPASRFPYFCGTKVSTKWDFFLWIRSC